MSLMSIIFRFHYVLPVTVSVSECWLGRGRRGLVSASSLCSPLPRLWLLPVLPVLPRGLLVSLSLIAESPPTSYFS